MGRSGHRLFAAALDFTSRHESRGERATREAVVAGAHGQVLEIGFGVGPNWAYLPEGVRYAGIDPDPFMMKRARRHAAERGLRLELLRAGAERMPFADATFDTVFTTLTFCTIAGVPRALAEVRRVLRPGGEFLFWEHVRPERGLKGRLFDAVTPAWRRVGGGCYPNRRTADAISAAGFTIRELTPGGIGPLPTIRGVAVVEDRH
ncbi:MAG: class I SAM-dependent methyltransferase [Chloroflexi bacterium CFX7]|nr:MAG: class I SAM-dependent methyltransferase [bacterium]MCE7928238.1 class I SAM-dependent methyltransferase [Chloroflexi bacterium CFX7]MCK6564833.1 class I SAM-dependent methyltransferase [Dehalococcoidia bacterium]